VTILYMLVPGSNSEFAQPCRKLIKIELKNVLNNMGSIKRSKSLGFYAVGIRN